MLPSVIKGVYFLVMSCVVKGVSFNVFCFLRGFVFRAQKINLIFVSELRERKGLLT